MTTLIDPIEQYQRKLDTARQRLAGTFIVFINAPDVAADRQGYLLCGSYQKPDIDEFPNFDAYTVGATASDIRDISESLTFWDAEERTEHAQDGSDYHAIVAAKALAQYTRDILRDARLPLALTVETVFVDTMSEIIVLHVDGELEQFDLDRTPTARFLAGDPDVTFRTRVMNIVWTGLGASAVPTEDEVATMAGRVVASFPDVKVELFELSQLCRAPSDNE